MQRRQVLRRGCAALTALTSVGLAGCSNSGGHGGPGAGGGGGGASLQDSGPASGEVVSNSVDELEVVGLNSKIKSGEESDSFQVEVTVKNNGNEQASAMEYTYDFTLYDGGGADISGGGISKFSMDSDMGPGKTASVTCTPSLASDASPGDVAEYDLALNCEGMFAEGVYCDGSSGGDSDF